MYRDIIGFARERIAVAALQRAMGPDAFTWFSFGPAAGRTGTAHSIGEHLGVNDGANRPTENLVMVYGCVVARREAIGAVRFWAGMREDGEEVESEAVETLLRRPNQDMLWGEYVRILETHLSLYNLAAIYIDLDVTGRRPISLVPLHPLGIQATFGAYMPTGTPTITGWRYNDPATGQMRVFDRTQVVLHKGYNPDAPLASLSPISPLRRTILNDNGIREANMALLRNDSTPPFLLSAQGTLTSDQAKEIAQSWQDQQAGIRNRRKVAVLWGGIKAEKLGLSPAEMEFLEGIRVLRQDYYRVFRVCPAMVFDVIGETGLSQGSSTDEQIKSWWELVGFSELEIIAGMHNEILERFPAFAEGAKVYTDSGRIPVFVRARQAKIKDLQTLVSMGYRPNDAAEALELDLPEHPDNLGRVSFSQQVIGEEAEIQPPAPSVNKALMIFDDLERVLERHEVERTAAAGKALLARRDRLVRAEAQRWSRFYVEQRARVLERVKALPERASGAGRTREDAESLLGQVFPMAQENAALVARLAPIWTSEYQAGWDHFHQETGLPVADHPFQIDDFRVKAALQRWQVQGAMANDTTADALREILGKGIQDGMTNSQIGDQIADYYKNNCIGEDSARPQVAARTQVNGIVNESRLLAAQDVGGLLKVWNHGSPEEPRPSHVAAAQTYADGIPVEHKFQVGAYQVDAPGAIELPPDEKCNCGCFVTFKKA